jgi:hypothetical protein
MTIGSDLDYNAVHCKVKFLGKWDKGQKNILKDKATNKISGDE